MKEKSTVTYIKDGEEKTIKINKFNKNYVLAKLSKIYTSSVIKFANDISLIQFNNVTFSIDKICCENIRTICIFENCTFKQNSSKILNLTWGSFELINPNFIGMTRIIGHYLYDFILTLSDEKMELSLNITADNINLQGNMSLKEVRLGGNKIVLGNEKSQTYIKILPYSIYKTSIFSENLTLTNCHLENISKKPLIINSSTLIMDDDSIIKTNSDVIINDIKHKNSTNNTRTITKKDIIRMNLILTLKTYSNLLNKKIDTLADKYVRNELSELKQEIEKQENKLQKLKDNFYLEQMHKYKSKKKVLSKKSITNLEKIKK